MRSVCVCVCCVASRHMQCVCRVTSRCDSWDLAGGGSEQSWVGVCEVNLLSHSVQPDRPSSLSLCRAL